MIVFTCVFFLFWIVCRVFKKVPLDFSGKHKMIKVASIALVIALALSFFQMKSLVFGPDKTSGSIRWNEHSRPFHHLFADSAKPLNYFLPAQDHPVLSKITEPLIGTVFYGGAGGAGEQTLYLGYVALILAFIAYRRWKKRKRESKSDPREDFLLNFFICCFFIFMIFSFAPYWGKAGNFFIPFPSYFLYKIFPMFRNYARFGILVMLSLCVLVGFGLRDIFERITNARKKALVSFLLSGLIMFEFLNIPPYRLTDASLIPEVYQWLKEQPEDFAIAEYPLDGNTREYAFYQRIHQKKLVNCCLPNADSEEFQNKIMRLSDYSSVKLLNAAGVKYIIMHAEDYSHSASSYIQGEVFNYKEVYGLELVKSFPGVDVYEINSQKLSSGSRAAIMDNAQRVVKAANTKVVISDSAVSNMVRFKQGEKLEFNLRYMGIVPVGLLRMEVSRVVSYKGKDAYRLIMTAETNKFFSLFFKAKINMESFADINSLYSRGYEEVMERRGHITQKKKVIYNWQEQLIEYRGTKKRISSCPLDPVSAVYYVRVQELKLGKKFYFDIDVSERTTHVEAEVLEKRTVKTKSGFVDAWVIRASLRKEKETMPKNTFFFLVADDENRTLLSIKGKTVVGFISIE